MQETWVWSLGQENPTEKGMVTYTSILACSPPGSSIHGVTESDTTERLSLHFKHSYTYVMIYSNRHVLNDFQVPGLRISRYLSCPALKRSLHCQELNCSQMLYFSGSSRRQYQWLGTRIRKNFHELGFLDSSVGKESNCNAGDPGSIHWRSIPLQYSWTSLVDKLVKKPTLSAGDLGSIPGLGRSPGEGKGYPLQYSGLENSMDCIVHGVAKNQTQLSDFHFMKASTKCPEFNTHILSKWHVHHWQLVNFSFPLSIDYLWHVWKISVIDQMVQVYTNPVIFICLWSLENWSDCARLRVPKWQSQNKRCRSLFL